MSYFELFFEFKILLICPNFFGFLTNQFQISLIKKKDNTKIERKIKKSPEILKEIEIGEFVKLFWFIWFDNYIGVKKLNLTSNDQKEIGLKSLVPEL